jgi:hypothetical protein
VIIDTIVNKHFELIIHSAIELSQDYEYKSSTALKPAYVQDFKTFAFFVGIKGAITLSGIANDTINANMTFYGYNG